MVTSGRGWWHGSYMSLRPRSSATGDHLAVEIGGWQKHFEIILVKLLLHARDICWPLAPAATHKYLRNILKRFYNCLKTCLRRTHLEFEFSFVTFLVQVERNKRRKLSLSSYIISDCFINVVVEIFGITLLKSLHVVLKAVLNEIYKIIIGFQNIIELPSHQLESPLSNATNG